MINEQESTNEAIDDIIVDVASQIRSVLADIDCDDTEVSRPLAYARYTTITMLCVALSLNACIAAAEQMGDEESGMRYVKQLREIQSFRPPIDVPGSA